MRHGGVLPLLGLDDLDLVDGLGLGDLDELGPEGAGEALLALAVGPVVVDDDDEGEDGHHEDGGLGQEDEDLEEMF